MKLLMNLKTEFQKKFDIKKHMLYFFFSNLLNGNHCARVTS